MNNPQHEAPKASSRSRFLISSSREWEARHAWHEGTGCGTTIEVTDMYGQQRWFMCGSVLTKLGTVHGRWIRFHDVHSTVVCDECAQRIKDFYSKRGLRSPIHPDSVLPIQYRDSITSRSQGYSGLHSLLSGVRTRDAFYNTISHRSSDCHIILSPTSPHVVADYLVDRALRLTWRRDL